MPCITLSTHTEPLPSLLHYCRPRRSGKVRILLPVEEVSKPKMDSLSLPSSDDYPYIEGGEASLRFGSLCTWGEANLKALGVNYCKNLDAWLVKSPGHCSGPIDYHDMPHEYSKHIRPV